MKGASTKTRHACASAGAPRARRSARRAASARTRALATRADPRADWFILSAMATRFGPNTSSSMSTVTGAGPKERNTPASRPSPRTRASARVRSSRSAAASSARCSAPAGFPAPSAAWAASSLRAIPAS